MPRRSLPIAGNVNPRSIHEAAVAALAPSLKRPVARASAGSAAVDAEAWSDELTQAIIEAVPPDEPIACRTGCAHCCYLKVTVTAPEAIHLVESLRARLDDDALAALRARVATTNAKTHGMTVRERTAARVPCPLLANDLCLAHDARPLGCRGANSYDADFCKRALEAPDAVGEFRFYRPQAAIDDALRAGLSTAAAVNRLDGTLLELIAALHLLLTRPHVADEWGTGRIDALTPARDDEFARLVRSPAPKR